MRNAPLLPCLGLAVALMACDHKADDDKSADSKKADDGPAAFAGPLTPELVASIGESSTEIMSHAADYAKAIAFVESKLGKANMVDPDNAWWAIMDADGKTCHGYSLVGDGNNAIKRGVGPSKMSGATMGYEDCVKAAGGTLQSE